MDAVTYPNDEVKQLTPQFVIPLRLHHDDPELAPKYTIKWTPALLTLDKDGVVHQRITGFLGPEEFLASQLLGAGKMYFDLGDYDKALANFSTLERRFAKSTFIPEMTYYRGVAQYKSSHDPKNLRKAYDMLKSSFPDNQWTERAYPYRLID